MVMLPRLLLRLAGAFVSSEALSKLLTVVFKRLREKAATTATPIDDAAIDAVETAIKTLGIIKDVAPVAHQIILDPSAPVATPAPSAG